ncbi:MAG: hypothetical protein HGA75_06815 [Thiobacillus sp.]|nr:hypothetical protein [Thiobacillus sp.]
MASLFAGLSGCGAGGGAETGTATPQEQLLALETAGAIPKLERDASVAGVDANSNGVRDDVEAYIAANYGTETERAAAMQYAKAMQAALQVDTSDIAAVKEVKRRLSRAGNCVYARFDGAAKQPAAVNAELRAISTNTKQRLLAYLAYNKALDGTSWAMPEGDTCE